MRADHLRLFVSRESLNGVAEQLYTDWLVCVRNAQQRRRRRRRRRLRRGGGGGRRRRYCVDGDRRGWHEAAS